MRGPGPQAQELAGGPPASWDTVWLTAGLQGLPDFTHRRALCCWPYITLLILHLGVDHYATRDSPLVSKSQ